MKAIAKGQMQETRRRILELLKLQGPLTADELSEALGITATGVRGHLVALERDGLVDHHQEQRGKGRPSYVFSLTEAGDELFPRTYPELANSLLDAVRELEGKEGIDRIFEARTQKLEARYRTRTSGKSLGGRVAELAKLRAEEGYMADWVELDEDTYLLREHNCAICQIAERCAQACSYELELFRRVFDDAKVTRRQHMFRGDRTCTYAIERAGGSP